MNSPVAVYVHIPFCPSKCGYCDFNSYAMDGNILERTTRAIEHEILNSPNAGRPAKTIFFGGGTPTFLSAEQLNRILDAVKQAHPPDGDIEVTSEANPGTVDAAKFADMRQAGFNRISLGGQSFDAHELIQLGRVHHADEIVRAVKSARTGGFENVSLDLMFALPGQNMDSWQRNLDTAVALETDHLSLYCLTIEPNTRFYRLNLRGMLALPNEDKQVQMYEAALATCERAGLIQYEISNFAKPGHQSQHNLCYWRAEEYLGYGPGAVGAFDTPEGRLRQTKIKHPERYCDAVENDEMLACEMEMLSSADVNVERIMLGIRLNEGLARETTVLDQGGLDSAQSRGWISIFGDRIQLTDSGRHFGQDVAVMLAPIT